MRHQWEGKNLSIANYKRNARTAGEPTEARGLSIYLTVLQNETIAAGVAYLQV